MDNKAKVTKQMKNLFTSGSAAFIKQALESFKSNDEMVILSALTELCSELSMANDSVGEDQNSPELIKQLIILLDKFPMLPDISLFALNCINYLLDINPRSTSSVVKLGGVQKIVKLAENVEYIDCVESAIKTIEKMSYENTFTLVEKGAFISVLSFFDFLDLNLRKSALKACLNMSKPGTSVDFVKKYILPAVPNLTLLTKLSGGSEIEKSICDSAIQCFYYIVSGTKNYNFSADLNEFCNTITQYGLLDNLFELFEKFIKIEDDKDNKENMNMITSNTAKNNELNVNVDTIKTILKLFDILCTISPSITNFLLSHNTLELIYKALHRELDKTHSTNSNSNEDSNKLSSTSHSLYLEIFGLLISFFPGKTNNSYNIKNQPLNRIMSPENNKHLLYFSDKILTLLIDNILHIPSSTTTLGLIKLISMYCSNCSIEYIVKYINDKQLANSLSKNLDSKDSSYILEVLILVDIIMQRCPEHFFISFLREGVVENIRTLKNVQEKLIYVSKDTTLSKIKNALPLQLTSSASGPIEDIDESIQIINNTLQKAKSTVPGSSNHLVAEVIKGNAKFIEAKYFSKEKINEYISKTDFKGKMNPIEIIENLEKYKNILKDNKVDENQDTIKNLISLLINNNITFFEIEKSEIVLYLSNYFDSNFISNYKNTIDSDGITQVILANTFNCDIIQRVKKFFSAFEGNSENLLKFVSILQQCISTMNCFKLYFYEYDNIKTTTNLFLSVFQGVQSKLSQNISIKMIYDTKNADNTLKETVLNDFNCMKEVYEFFEKNPTNKMRFDTSVKFDELKEDILNYPSNIKNKDINEIEDDYLQDFLLKSMIDKEANADVDSITIKSEQFLQKFIEQKQKREELKKLKAQEKNNNIEEVNNDTEKKEEKIDNKGPSKEEIAAMFEEFLLKYDIEFWIELAEGKKYTIKNSQSISDLLKDTKNQMQRADFLKFCSDLKIHFKFIKKEAKKEEASSSQSDIKLSFSNNTISYEELNKLLFEHFYYENIINNKALYNIKRASPFFYLLSLIYLCQDNFNSYFNIDKIPLQNFENLKMSSLLFKQVRDPYAISSKSIPSWCKEVNISYPFFTNFSSRYLLFKTTAFDTKRSMANLYIYLRNFLGEHLFEDKSINTLFTNIKRVKVKIHRDKILEDSYALTSQFDSFNGYLEFEYYNETGTGMGPTLEFYSLFFKAISDIKGLWYKTEDYSLFPLPLVDLPAKDVELIKKYFTCLGYVIARGLYDDRLIDVPINSLFWDLVLKRPFNINSIEKVDKYVYKFIKEQIEKKNIKDNSLDSCDLYFTLPWNENVPLIPNGENIKLTNENLDEYVYQVLNKMLIEGQKDIIEAFRFGFNKVFDINELKSFSSSEIEEVICGSENSTDNTWTYENLTQNILPMHGFTKDSMIYKSLIQILINMNTKERKMFLLFVTGSPRLPLGGFKNLYPKLTVVMFQSESMNDSPNSHLPSVMTCQNYLKIPNYTTKEILKEKLFTAIKEGNNAFHLS